MTELESLCSCPDIYWHGMYQGNSKYQKYRVQEANSHPAKMSMVLADYILKHLEKLNLMSPGISLVPPSQLVCEDRLVTIQYP
ncbi:MAG: hypothetical protein ACYDDC_00815 [Thermoplasmataceae archaeon]